MKQQYSSKDTSVNTVSRVYKNLNLSKQELRGKLILDYGGGKYDTNTEYMRENYGARVVVFDPYNRSANHNAKVRHLVENSQVDIIVCSNVLCVIREDSVILDILNDVKNLMSAGTRFYVTVYERDRTGIGTETSKGWQRNQKLDDYLPFFKTVFFEDFYTFEKKNNVLMIRQEV